jgi:hypothetical protein
MTECEEGTVAIGHRPLQFGNLTVVWYGMVWYGGMVPYGTGTTMVWDATVHTTSAIGLHTVPIEHNRPLEPGT